MKDLETLRREAYAAFEAHEHDMATDPNYRKMAQAQQARGAVGKVYSLQHDAHNNAIVCKGTERRSGYRITFTGTYSECLARK